MTQNQFMLICAQYAIPPSIALENKNVRTALLRAKSGKYPFESAEQQLSEILKTEF